MLPKLENYIYTHARPLDFTLFKYFNGDASKQAVLDILWRYQNEDGGFGHALEPDNWNPHSTPMATWKATQYLRQLDVYDSTDPHIAKMVEYLLKTRNNEGFWPFTVAQNNDYPCAVWWQHKGQEQAYAGYNPTASLLGYLQRLGVADLSDDIDRALAYLVDQATADMHEVVCWLDLYSDLSLLGNRDLTAAKVTLDGFLKTLISADNSDWQNYTLRPSTLFNHGRFRDFSAPFQTHIQSERQYLKDTQLKNGAWPLAWQWHTDYSEFEVAKVWWQAIIGIKYGRFIKCVESE